VSTFTSQPSGQHVFLPLNKLRMKIFFIDSWQFTIFQLVSFGLFPVDLVEDHRPNY